MGYPDQWEVGTQGSVKWELFTPKYLIHLYSERHKISSSSSYCDPISGLEWINWPIRGQETEHQRGSGNQFYHQGSANTISKTNLPQNLQSPDKNLQNKTRGQVADFVIIVDQRHMLLFLGSLLLEWVHENTIAREMFFGHSCDFLKFEAACCNDDVSI